MKSAFTILLFVVMMLTLSGCASKYMQSVDDPNTHLMVSKNETAIVFFRPQNMGFMIRAPIAVKTAKSDLKYVGIVTANGKILYKTTPGKYIFVVGGEIGDVLEVDMAAGKTYYAYVNPVLGYYKARFAFGPVTRDRINSQAVQDDLEECSWYKNTPQGNIWFEENKASMLLKYTEAMLSQKVNSAYKTLKRNDGI
jgi:hypothetical protein